MLCAWCKAEFSPRHPRGRFCGAPCRVAHWHAAREQELAQIEEALERTLARVREFRQRRGTT